MSRNTPTFASIIVQAQDFVTAVLVAMALLFFSLAL